MSTTEKGTSYEKFVQAIYRTLHDADGFEHITIEQNKTDLQGRSGCTHQIDVYWEFKIAGHSYRTAIECKAYDKPVSIGRVRDFYGVLSDVSGLQGIFVSLYGFQAGAKKYAEHYGINLKEIRVPTQEDWDGRIRDMHVRLFVVEPTITAIRPDIVKSYLEKLGPDNKIDMPFEGTTYDSFVVNERGEHVASVEEIRQQLSNNNQAATGLEEVITFPGCYYQSSTGERIPIDSVSVRYDISVEVENVDLLGEQVARAIMKDVQTGEISFFEKRGGVHAIRK